MSGFLDSIREVIGNGWNPDVPTEGVRPDYGLGTAQFRPMQKSQHERTLESGETRSPEDLQSMLAEVILAAGAKSSGLVGPRGKELARTAARTARRNVYHGTLKDISKVESAPEPGARTRSAVSRLGKFWSESPEVASYFTRKPNPENRFEMKQADGGRIIPGSVRSRNPEVIDALDFYKRFMNREATPEAVDAYRAELLAKGRDALHIKANPKADDMRSHWAFPNEFGSDMWVSLNDAAIGQGLKR